MISLRSLCAWFFDISLIACHFRIVALERFKRGFMYILYIMARTNRKQFVLTKKIAKHGSQAVIIIPKILQNELRPQTIVQLKIDILEESEEK
jgi:hypothetical protein